MPVSKLVNSCLFFSEIRINSDQLTNFLRLRKLTFIHVHRFSIASFTFVGSEEIKTFVNWLGKLYNFKMKQNFAFEILNQTKV